MLIKLALIVNAEALSWTSKYMQQMKNVSSTKQRQTFKSFKHLLPFCDIHQQLYKKNALTCPMSPTEATISIIRFRFDHFCRI